MKPIYKVKGREKYLYRAVDSTGQAIDFLLTAKRDAAAAKWFFRKVFRSSNNPISRVINVDKNPAYPAAIRALKRDGILPRRVRLRQCKYLNNIVEQDHRSVKKRTRLAKGYGSFQSAWRTLEGIETVNMIRKRRVRWVSKDDASAQARFVGSWAPSIRLHGLIGIACWASIPSLSCLAVRSQPPNRSASIRTMGASWPVVHSDPA